VAEALWRRARRSTQTRPAWGRRALLLLGAVGGLALFHGTINRNVVWSSGQRLWTETAHQEPRSWRAWYRIGDILRNQADSTGDRQEKAALLEQAERSLSRSKALWPYYADTRNALGNVYLTQGRLEKAIAEYTALLEIAPHNTNAAINLCQAYAHSRPPDYELAAHYMQRAIFYGFDVDADYKRDILASRRKAILEGLAAESSGPSR
jgi:tetratricopeptide (TPR) repeat protein